MFEAGCFFLFALAVLVFAVVGLVVTLRRLAAFVGSQEDRAPSAETIDTHLISTCVMLNRLRRSGDLSAEQYHQFRDLLEAQSPWIGSLPERLQDDQTVSSDVGPQTESKSPATDIPFAPTSATQPAPPPLPDQPAPQDSHGSETPDSNVSMADVV